MPRRCFFPLALAALIAATNLSCQQAAPRSGSSSANVPRAWSSPLGPARQLTFEGRRAGEGYFDRAGKRLVFQSEREPNNPFFQIYLMDLASGRVERASPGIGKTTCGWIHPSDTRLLFSSTHLDPASANLQLRELERRESGEQRRYQWDYDSHYDIFSRRLPLGQDRPHRLTSSPGYDAEASWSPDGRQIVFASNRHAYSPDGALSASLSDDESEHAEPDLSRFIDIYTMDARGGSVRRLTDTAGYDGGPFFSPNGQRIVFRRFSEDHARAEIFSMRRDGSDVRQLTHLGALSWAPFYHPSGDYLIFSTNVHGFDDFELYVVRANGSGPPVRVTEQEGFDGLPAFSPDGSEVVFTRKPPNGRSQLYRAAWDDELARQQLGLPSRSFHGAGPLLAVPTGLSNAIEPADLRRLVEDLASDATDGRLTGSAGERIATGYVARVLRSRGLAPAGDDDTYFQEFGFTAGVSLGEQNALGTEDGNGLVVNTDWRPLSFSSLGEVPSAEIVFAGYGIVAPDEDGLGGVDDYAHLDVGNRWVLVLRYLPEGLDKAGRRRLNRHSSLRYKARAARDKGARGILFVTGPHSKLRKQLVPLRFDASLAGAGIAAVSLSDAAADALIRKGSRHTLADLQASLDREIQAPGFLLEGPRLGGHIDVRQQRQKARNVLARLPASKPGAAAAVLIGAHIDHLGHGEGTSSLARAEERGAIHRGADDNASGVSALIEIADYLASEQAGGRLETVRDVVFAAWSGEELGLLGSSAFAKRELERLGQGRGQDLSGGIAAYLNLDMVGRLRDKLSLMGVDSSPVWRRSIEQRNVPIGLRIQPLAESYLPTDATSFYLRRVPILSAFTGSHEDYHTPRDVPERLDYRSLAKIAQLIASIAGDLAMDEDAPRYVAAKNPAAGLPRAGMRVYLGTIPDYTNNSTRPGLALSGVAAGGPAERAGLQAGDVVVEVDGRAIENIYDYTYSLEGLKAGVPVSVVVRRAGSRKAVTLTPASRD
ncbi:MAG: M28 family peptidase [Myxococcota bacterium]|nr:M28 family peptidase [Myxococcota bacterium]